MKKVDEFILENKKRMSEEIEMLEPSSVILPGDLPLMEIDKEIDAYLNNKTRVVSSTKSNQGAEQIAKETEREVQMENYDQGVPV